MIPILSVVLLLSRSRSLAYRNPMRRSSHHASCTNFFIYIYNRRCAHPSIDSWIAACSVCSVIPGRDHMLQRFETIVTDVEAEGSGTELLIAMIRLIRECINTAYDLDPLRRLRSSNPSSSRCSHQRCAPSCIQAIAHPLCSPVEF
jgi:hypothetical protein